MHEILYLNGHIDSLSSSERMERNLVVLLENVEDLWCSVCACLSIVRNFDGEGNLDDDGQQDVLPWEVSLTYYFVNSNFSAYSRTLPFHELYINADYLFPLFISN